MPARVKVDENLPRDVRDLLKSRGHDAATVLDEQMSGASDGEVLAAAQRERRILVTSDKGFADIRRGRAFRGTGIVLLRPARPGRAPVVQLMRQVLDTYDLAEVAGRIMVASPAGIRFRTREP